MGTLSKMLNTEGESMSSQIEARTGEEVIAAGQLRQGRKPSMAAMMTGTALIEALRPRRSKSLPRHFVLAVTERRVVAFKCIGVADDEYGENFRVVVRGEEAGSWAREGVSCEGLSGKSDGTLHLGGEAILINRPNQVDDPETDELVELLGR